MARSRLLLSSLLAVAVSSACGGAKVDRAAQSNANVLTVPASSTTARSADKGADEETAPNDALAFEILQGPLQNLFYRRGRVAAHVVAGSGKAPRIVFAFPAGNVGAGLWFAPTQSPIALTVRGPLKDVERGDGLRGVVAELHAKDGPSSIHVQRWGLASLRVLRDLERGGAIPEGQAARFVAADEGKPILAKRTAKDGRHHLELDVEPLGGTQVKVEPDGSLTLSGAPEIAVRLTALGDDAPLTPLSPSELLSPAAARDPRLANVLSFLAYREKLLAGSWHDLTYFGRDTLLVTRLLLPVLRSPVIEAALGSVIERLSPDGEVAHEEDDYTMVDEDFLLSSVLDEYFSTAEGKSRASAFFALKTSSGRTYGDAVRKNLARVVKQATPFGEKRSALSLVAIERGHKVGNWRDSEKGLAGGIYPYDVNVALVPAALQATGRLTEAGALPDAELSARAKNLASAWTHTERFFRVDVPAAEAKKRVAAYAGELGISPDEAVDAISGPVTFRGVSLDAKGTAIPIMHSDDGFVMLFGAPDANLLEEMARRIARPFPLGLRTPVGIVVANPALAPDAATHSVLGRKDEHGTVVWSGQQALLAAGVKRQLARNDLSPKTRAALEKAEDTLWVAIDATREAAREALWTFRIDRGKFVRVPFAQEAGHDDQTNAAQLWSTVYLGVRSPSVQ